jgi:hypothetical protein
MCSCHEDPSRQEAGGSVRSSVDALADEVRVRAGVLEATVHGPRCVARGHKLVVLLTDSQKADRLTLPVTRDAAQCTG